MIIEADQHRVDRVLSFFSSRRNWDSSNPSPAGECAPHPLVQRGAHPLAGEGLGESQFQRGHTLWYSVYISTLCCAGSEKLNFFAEFRFVPSFGIGSSVELGMPRNEHFLPRNNGTRSESIPRNFFGTKFRSQP